MERRVLAFLVIAAAVIYGLAAYVPAHLPVKITVKKIALKSPIALLGFPEEPVEVGMSLEVESPLAEEEIDQLRAYMRIQDTFESRFGFPFQQAWEPQEPIHHDFKVPEGIKDMVYFWTQVFGKYGKDQYIFHHKENLSVVYSVLDLSSLDPLQSGMAPEEAEDLRKKTLKEETARIQKMLKRLALRIHRPRSLNEAEQGIMANFSSSEELLTAMKAENIRIQSGFAHRFEEAIERSGQYMQEMENIFTLKGLPIELTRLPIIESAFKQLAFSSASAAGIWQFIPETGRRYLRIDEYVDERYDPILATYAAAEHLSREFKLLGSWPLAINSYNTGPGRMIKAKKELGTDDIAVIIKNFKSAGYQFYSRNYFPEFLAALEVYHNQESYFGPIEKMAPLSYDHFIPEKPINLQELANAVEIDRDLLADLNPGLRAPVLEGKKDLPKDYFVRIPKDFGLRFVAAAPKLYQEEGPWHLVKNGETFVSIADQYKIFPADLRKENKRKKLVPGVRLKLPAIQ